MEKIRQILVNNESADVKNDDVGFGLDSNCENGDGEEAILEIVCLGTGKGATTLFTGEPSSSFVLLDKGKPFLIVDLGFGVFQSYKKLIGSDAVLGHVYITHNHADHAAELPVALAVINDARSKHPGICMPTVYAAPEVLHRVRTHRLVEVTTQAPVEQMAHFKTCETGRCKTPIGDDGVFSMCVLPSQHSETCYGFILYKNNEPILAYSGDSGFNRELYDQLFTVPNVILDARCTSTYEHAGFAEVENYLAARPHLNCRVFLTGYGTTNEYPVDGIVGASPFQTGGRYLLYSNRSSVSSGDKCLMPQRTSITAEYLMPVETA